MKTPMTLATISAITFSLVAGYANADCDSKATKDGAQKAKQVEPKQNQNKVDPSAIKGRYSIGDRVPIGLHR